MATSKPAQTLQAYVLHRWDWSETSLIVELFTRERGRVVVVAKGAKRPTSNFRALLLPFHPIQALLSKQPADEQGEVHGLRSAEWTGGEPLLPAALMFSAFYLNELLMKLLAREDAHPVLFDGYMLALRALAGGVEEAAVLRAFELMLLRETGLLPDLATDTLGAQPLDLRHTYTLQAQAGLLRSGQGLSGQLWLALAAALEANDAPALFAACAQAGPTLRLPLREVLHYHLGTTPLRTRQVWQGVQNLQKPPAHTSTSTADEPARRP
jgi:DNA repair protein RecO (recombination protein O)